MMLAGSRSAACALNASRLLPGNCFARTAAPVLEAPPGSQLPSGERCEYTTPVGSQISSLVTPLSTSVVPSTEFQLPTSNAPAPIWAAQPSVIPAMIGVPAGMPVISAASVQTEERRVGKEC